MSDAVVFRTKSPPPRTDPMRLPRLLRRLFRFRLRSLLLFTTLAAAAFAWLSYEIQAFHHQHHLLSEIPGNVSFGDPAKASVFG